MSTKDIAKNVDWSTTKKYSSYEILTMIQEKLSASNFTWKLISIKVHPDTNIQIEDLPKESKGNS